MEVIRMGIYLDPGNTDFQMAVNSEIYVDKSKMITLTNKIINSENRFVCVPGGLANQWLLICLLLTIAVAVIPENYSAS